MFHEYIEGAGILHQTSASLDDNNNNIDISRLVIWHNVAFRPQPFQKSHFHPWVEVEYSSVYMGMGKVGCQGKPEQVVMKLHNNSNMSDLVAFKCGSEDPPTICGHNTFICESKPRPSAGNHFGAKTDMSTSNLTKVIFRACFTRFPVLITKVPSYQQHVVIGIRNWKPSCVFCLWYGPLAHPISDMGQDQLRGFPDWLHKWVCQPNQ